MDSTGWDNRYEGSELVWTAEPNRFVVEETAGLDVGRAIDLAAGEGRNAIWLADAGWRVTAVDFSPVGIAKGRELAARQEVTVDWQVADLTRYEPEPRGYDLVLIAYLHLPKDEIAGVLRRAAAAVAPGGTFLFVGHDLTNLTEGVGGPQDPAVLHTPASVVAELGDLDVVKAEEARRPVGEATAIDTLVRAVRTV